MIVSRKDTQDTLTPLIYFSHIILAGPSFSIPPLSISLSLSLPIPSMR